MKDHPLRTTVIGSYPFPGWLEFDTWHLQEFGTADREELIDDAVTVAIQDQLNAGLDVITDGEQTRLDFNLSFYGFLEGIEMESASPRHFGPPAHDQRGKHKIVGELSAPKGLGTVEDFNRFKRLASRQISNLKSQISDSPAAQLSTQNNSQPSTTLKASVPGPYTLSGRLLPNAQYSDRYAVTEALLPIVRRELEQLVEAGCEEITVDEPSMSCYAHREDPNRFVDIFNRTVEPIVGKCRLSTHLCFGNFKGHAVGPRRYAPLFPAFLDMHLDEIHVEMASREFSEIEIIETIAKKCDVAVGVIDVKSYYIEPVDQIADRVRECMKHAPADRLSFAPDCGLSQTARWAAKQKLKNMVEGVRQVRSEL
jgi:5-methyltetrahydropteroyltriglutamate--homocysteine methyltransferase